MKNTDRMKLIWRIGLGFTLFSLLFSAAILLIPFDKLKSWIDLLSPDGNFESFTTELITILRYPALGVFLFSLFVGYRFLAHREEILGSMQASSLQASNFLCRRKEELSDLWSALITLESSRTVIILIFTTTIIGAIIRLAYLWRPMGHDEAYTFIAFASRGLRVAITDYHLPNNHVFHTILVSLVYQIFGDSPAIVRLPALLAGILTIPAIFIIGRIFYDRHTGLISAAIIASAPIMVDYSTNARGYTLVTLITLLLIGCGAYVIGKKNLTAWGIFVSLASLGMYTNPTMIYPIAVVYCWMFLNGVFRYLNPNYGHRFFLYLFISSFSIVSISLILYAPIIIYSGVDSLMGNNFIASLSWSDFVESIPVRIRNTWGEWNRDIPSFVQVIAISGLSVSVVTSILGKKRTFPLILAVVIAIGVLLLFQRVAPWPRVWLFLLPILVVWVVAGLIAIIKFVIQRINWNPSLIERGSIVFVIILLLWGLSRSYGYHESRLNSAGEVERAAVFLSTYLKSGDVIVVKAPDTVILDYYLRRNGIDRGYLDLTDLLEFDRALVLVDTGYGQDLLDVLTDRSFTENVDISQAELVYQTDRLLVYHIPNIKP
jgi:hypothetical protein